MRLGNELSARPAMSYPAGPPVRSVESFGGAEAGAPPAGSRKIGGLFTAERHPGAVRGRAPSRLVAVHLSGPDQAKLRMVARLGEEFPTC